MHEQVIEAMRKKIYGFLYGCRLNNLWMYDPADWKLLGGIADYILKKSPVAMEKVDVIMAIMSIMSSGLDASEDAKGKHKNVPYLLRDVVDVVELTSVVIGFFESLPRRYYAYFELPNGRSSIDFCAHIADGIELLTISRDLVRGSSVTILGSGLPDEDILCIRISLSGYINSVSSTSFDKGAKIIKALLERAIAVGILRVPLWSGKTSVSGQTFIHTLSDSDVLESRAMIELPFDLSSMLNKLELGAALAKADSKEFIETTIFELMSGFRTIFSRANVEYDNLMAACEWGFDALAETSNPMKAVKICIGLESIYGERSEEGGITRSLVDRCSYSLAKTAEERSTISAKCRQLYSLRSKVVHGVARALSSEEVLTLDFGLKILKDSIEKEIFLIKL